MKYTLFNNNNKYNYDLIIDIFIKKVLIILL